MSVLKLQSILLRREIVNILRSCIHVNELAVTEENSDHTELFVGECTLIHKENFIFQCNADKRLVNTSKIVNMKSVVQRTNKIVTANVKNQITFSIDTNTLCLYVFHRCSHFYLVKLLEV